MESFLLEKIKHMGGSKQGVHERKLATENEDLLTLHIDDIVLI
jgi:hypothetical protein